MIALVMLTERDLGWIVAALANEAEATENKDQDQQVELNLLVAKMSTALLDAHKEMEK